MQNVLPIPAMNALKKLGADIDDGRRRRRISVALMAERAGISPKTYLKIKNGEPAVSMAGYASVLFVLGLSDGLRELADAAHDLTGRMLEEERLPKRIRRPKNG